MTAAAGTGLLPGFANDHGSSTRSGSGRAASAPLQGGIRGGMGRGSSDASTVGGTATCGRRSRARPTVDASHFSNTETAPAAVAGFSSSSLRRTRERAAVGADSFPGLQREGAGVPGVYLLSTTVSPVRAWLVEDLRQTDGAGARGSGWWLREIVERAPRRAWMTWVRWSSPVARTSSRRAVEGSRRGPPPMRAVGTFGSLEDAMRAAAEGLS